MHTPVIALDVDSVLLDALTPWLNALNETTGHRLTPRDIDRWDFHELFGVSSSEMWQHRKPEHYATCEPVAGAQEGVEALRAEGYHLVALTSDMRSFADAKAAAVRKHFPCVQDMVIAKNKRNVLQYDILIDDYARNMPDILLAQPWNVAELLKPGDDALIRVDWPDVTFVVRELLRWTQCMTIQRTIPDYILQHRRKTVTIGFDASSETIGVCAIFGNGVIEHIDAFALSGDIYQKMLQAHDFVCGLLDDYFVNKIGIESPVNLYGGSIIPQMHIQSTIKLVATLRGINVIDVAPKEAKKRLTGSGDASKQLMLAMFMANNFPHFKHVIRRPLAKSGPNRGQECASGKYGAYTPDGGLPFVTEDTADAYAVALVTKGDAS